MLVERCSDLGIQLSEALVEGQGVGGELGNDSSSDLLAGKRDGLRPCRADGSCCDRGVVAHPSPLQPPGQPRFTDTVKPLWAGVAGEQDEGALAG